MISSSRLIKALKRQPVDRSPLWIMRQAGRYLPEYRAIRESTGGSFLKMCKNPEIACEVTLQPLKRFDLDAAIIFSDILTIPDAMGLGLHFIAEGGPQFEFPVRDIKAIEQLPTLDPNTDLQYVMQAIALVKQSSLQVPLIGFCGSPWTVATYMVEGKSSRTFSTIKSMLYQDPQSLLALLSKLTRASCDYLHAQILAGVDVCMIFDTWGGVLSGAAYRQFSLHFMQEIVSYLKSHALTKHIPIILFTKQGGQWLEDIAETGCDAIGIDWTQDLHHARSRVGEKVALQGNLDPTILYASNERIGQEVKSLLAAYGTGSGHIVNLGHGIYPDISPEKVQVMIEAVHQYSPAYHP